LQIYQPTTAFGTNLYLYFNSNRATIKDMYLEGPANSSSYSNILDTGQGLCTVINTVVVCNTAATRATHNQCNGGLVTFIGCTFVRATDNSPGGVAIHCQYGTTNVIQSCAFLGFTTPVNDTAKFHATNCKYNATDQASGLPGTNTVYSVTYSQTTPFVDADKDSLDLRAVASTALAGAGFLDGTNAPLDISKTTRAASPTIGAWELAAGGGGATYPGYQATQGWQ
jgi:hypothetical protein